MSELPKPPESQPPTSSDDWEDKRASHTNRPVPIRNELPNPPEPQPPTSSDDWEDKKASYTNRPVPIIAETRLEKIARFYLENIIAVAVVVAIGIVCTFIFSLGWVKGFGIILGTIFIIFVITIFYHEAIILLLARNVVGISAAGVCAPITKKPVVENNDWEDDRPSHDNRPISKKPEEDGQDSLF